MGTGRELEAGDVAGPPARHSSGSPPSGHSPRAFEASAFEKVASPAAWLPGIGSLGDRTVNAWLRHRARDTDRDRVRVLRAASMSRDCSCPSLSTPHFLSSSKPNKRLRK